MSCCGGSGTTQDHPQEVIKIHDAAGNKPGAIQYNVAPGKHEEYVCELVAIFSLFLRGWDVAVSLREIIES
jgi:hypothetical protein